MTGAALAALAIAPPVVALALLGALLARRRVRIRGAAMGLAGAALALYGAAWAVLGVAPWRG